jgi:hypothetical protein
LNWYLPVSLEIDGNQYEINADYRDILNIISRLSDEGQDGQIRVYVSLALFYKNFPDMPEKDYKEAAEKMVWFISCGEEDSGVKRPKTIDWEQDYSMIVSDINKTAGFEVRSSQFLHWWTFISYFNGIGEGQLATVVAIREKLRKHKKLDDWERDFYRQNRDRVDFKRKYTAAENDIISKWTGGKVGE